MVEGDLRYLLGMCVCMHEAVSWLFCFWNLLQALGYSVPGSSMHMLHGTLQARLSAKSSL